MGWPPKDWRALIALLGSIAGAAALTGFLAWGFWLNSTGQIWTSATEELRAITNRWILWIAAGTIAVVIVGLGMAINRRTIRGKLGGASLDFEGGEADAPIPAPGPLPSPLFGQGEAQ
jgi:hypothetical protein